MVKESDLTIIQDEVKYINSLGKKVKRKPKKYYGAWYFLQAMYEDILYSEAYYMRPHVYDNNNSVIEDTRDFLINKILKKASKRGR